VRGLDYYNHTTFEFTTKELGSQGTVLAGGRYNGLIKLLGGDDTCGVGFAAGIERLALLCSMPEILYRPCGIIALTQQQEKEAMKLAQELRQKNLSIHYNPGLKLDKALKNAIKQNCKYVVFIGEDEIKNGYIKLKDLDKREETTVSINELYERVK
jgi:histidyl-tRNA synthetase